MIIDDALLVAYLKTKSPLLLTFAIGKNDCTIQNCIDLLIANQKNYVLSILYMQRSMHAETLEAWIRVVSGEAIDQDFDEVIACHKLSDPNFTGIDLIINYLKSLSDKAIVLRFGAWVLRNDTERGVKIFINRDDSLFNTDEVLTFLESFGDHPKKRFIEYDIIKLGSKVLTEY